MWKDVKCNIRGRNFYQGVIPGYFLRVFDKKKTVLLHYKIDPSAYIKWNPNAVLFIRTHRQSAVHIGEILTQIADLKKEYPDTHGEIPDPVEEFQLKMLWKARR